MRVGGVCNQVREVAEMLLTIPSERQTKDGEMMKNTHNKGKRPALLKTLKFFLFSADIVSREGGNNYATYH